MKNSDFLIDFNNNIKKGFSDLVVSKKVNTFFDIVKFEFKNYEIKKIGDFKYNTYNYEGNKIYLDIAIVIYSKEKPLPSKIFNEVLAKGKQSKKIHKTKEIGNLIQFYFREGNKKIIFNTIIIYSNKSKGFDYVIENNKWSKENVLKLTNDFVKANKISSNFLFSIKRILNYLIKDDFNYSYNIDMMLLRWFYEYISRTIKEHFCFNDSNTLDASNFLKIKNLSSWLKRRINFQSLGYFIINSMFKNTTYFYNEFDSRDIEIFEGVSRYSLNSLTGFYLPTNYYSEIKIFNIKKHRELNEYQNNMKISSGYSISAFDYARQNDFSIVCTPNLIEGISNINLLRWAIKEKAKNLYSLVSEEKRQEIVSSRSREHLEYLNQLAYNFLSSYKNKIEYIKVYFDKKYPFINKRGFVVIVEMIKTIINELNDDDWIIENDF